MVISAVSSPDAELASKLLGSGYFLQKFEGSSITYSSKDGLPRPQLTVFYQQTNASVIPTSLKSNLLDMQPYRQFIDGHLFLVIPIIINPAQKYGYLVYTRLLL